MTVQYLVDDKVFTSEQEALEYEKQKKLEEIEKLKKEQEQEKRATEVREAYDKFIELKDAYYKDYPIDSSKFWHDFFEDFFS